MICQFCKYNFDDNLGKYGCPNCEGTKMNKLIEKYRTIPSPTNRAKLQAYLQKHMMAVCLATQEEIAFLKANEFKI
jgi:rubredoxin